MKIEFRRLNDCQSDYKKLHKWCQEEFVYEWFEQRVLSYTEIVNKYQTKLKNGKQDLYIIKVDDVDIGLIQIYKYDDELTIKEISNCKNVYEYDIFIGEENYLNKGIGKTIIDLINKTIYINYNVDAIVLRPFKRNIRAIKCYQKCGYEFVRDYDGFDTLGNPEIISVLLYKLDINIMKESN